MGGKDGEYAQLTKVVFLNWSENNSKHHQVVDRDNFLVVETKDILTTLQFLTARIDTEEEAKERDRLDALFENRWSTDIRPGGGYVIWDKCAEFVDQLLSEIDSNSNESKLFVYCKWLDVSLAHCGFERGMCFAGQTAWSNWIKHARAAKTPLLDKMKSLARKNDYEILLNSIEGKYPE